MSLIRSSRNETAFLPSVLALVTGSAVAQAVPILLSPLLTRVYSPAQFGEFALFAAVTAILATIACGRYELAILLPKRDGAAVSVTLLSCLIAVGLSLLLSVVLTLWAAPLASLLHVSRPDKLMLVPLSVGAQAVIQALAYWMNRAGRFVELAMVRVWQALVMSAIQLQVLPGLPIASGLIEGFVAGQLLAAVILAVKFVRPGPGPGESLAEALRAYWRFPAYSAPAALLDALSMQMPLFLVQNSYEAFYIGIFGFAGRIIAAPLSLVGAAVAQVFFRQAAGLVQEGQSVLPTVKRTAGRLALLAICPFTVLLLAGPWLFGLVFGPEWRMAGVVTQILAVPFALRFVTSSISVVLSATGHLHASALWQGLYCLTTLTIVGWATRYSFLVFIRIYAVHELVLYLIYLSIVFWASRRGAAR